MANSEATAWVHDVGHAPDLAITAFILSTGALPRDHGARKRVVDLVAFHSSAWAEAQEYGVADELAEFEDERTLTRDLLWYCDMTTGPDGADLDSRTAWLRCGSATAPITTSLARSMPAWTSAGLRQSLASVADGGRARGSGVVRHGIGPEAMVDPEPDRRVDVDAGELRCGHHRTSLDSSLVRGVPPTGRARKQMENS